MSDQLLKERGNKEQRIVDRWQRDWGEFVQQRRELWRQMREATRQRDASRRFEQGLPMEKQALPTGERVAGEGELPAAAHHDAAAPAAQFPPVPRTTAAEVGWLAARPEWQVEVYGPCVRQPRWPDPPAGDQEPGL